MPPPLTRRTPRRRRAILGRGWFSGVFSLFALAFVSVFSLRAVTYEPASISPPSVKREFRGAWVATVANIDWPSKPGLTTAEQKSELVTILDHAARLKLNAIIFQVRPACDAMYASKLEPWSEFLTGTMGKAPRPYYDPLAFAVEAAHRRGLELHAWFNPYRAHHSEGKSPISANHISRTQPQLVREYGKYLWLDPGERAVQDYSLEVVMDVVKRYDIDGVHFDDYFFPYPITDTSGKELDFPDEASWKKHGAGGKLSRDDWRRQNVDAFIECVYGSIKSAKPWVKFGISPFGIWRPGFPPSIKGLDSYAKLYADSRKWLRNGWLDYCAPQLYWAIDPPAQSFPVLLNWWNEQNPKRRHLWPGLDTTKVNGKWKPQEILNQISLAEKQPVSAGHIHWNMKNLAKSAELGSALERGVYAEPALIPACTWLDFRPPPKPILRAVAVGNSSLKLSWQTSLVENVALWVLQCRHNEAWTTHILPGEIRSYLVDGRLPEAVSLCALDRAGNLGSAASLALRR